MYKSLLFFRLLLIVLIFASSEILATESFERNVILHLNGCEENEVVSDFNYYISKLNKYFVRNNISVRNSEKYKCGITLSTNDKAKEIEGILTDVDLAIIMNVFFEISPSK